jgi:hypothetical protein
MSWPSASMLEWVGGDLREAAMHAVVLQDGLD